MVRGVLEHNLAILGAPDIDWTFDLPGGDHRSATHPEWALTIEVEEMRESEAEEE